ncbi:formate/nitrite transporter family protein [bacterium]|nr:formate/nitrite transporter family protein [bacterium]
MQDAVSTNEENQNEESEAEIDTAEPRKPARRILEQEISEGLGEIQRSTAGLLMAGLSAGLDVGFSVLLIAVVLTRADNLNPLATELLVANMYSVGFIIVILGRSELFTEHTALAVMPLLNGQTTLRALGRLWGLVYVSNLVGGAAIAGLIVVTAPALGVVTEPVFGDLARRMVDHSWWVILLSGVLAGWLMGLVSWLVAASRDTIGQIVLIWLVTSAIGFSHLHHSIVGSVEVLAGLFAGQGITWAHFGHFLLWATLGNSIGGAVFVALVKYSHVVRSEAEMPKTRPLNKPDLMP